MDDAAESLPGPKINALVAELMGWTVLGCNDRFAHGSPPGSRNRSIIPRYCDHIDSAYEMETFVLASDAREIYIKILSERVLPAGAERHEAEHLISLAHASPLERCRAAIRALRQAAGA